MAVCDVSKFNRSISMLIESTEEMANQNKSNLNLELVEEPVRRHSAFDCFQLIEQQFSPDSEFDETLGIEGLDEVTVITVGGEEVIVKRTEGDGQAITEIPHGTIFNTPEKFKQKQRKLFLPNADINVEITDYDRNVTYHLLNPNLYTITLKHGQFTWQIKRRYADFQRLHTQLMMFKTSLKVPFPTKSHKQLRESFRVNKLNQIKQDGEQSGNSTLANETTKDEKEKKKMKKGALPRFPNRPDALVPFESIPARMKQLEDFLKNLLAISIYRQHPETVEFLEVSPVSFIASLGGKGKEGALKKRSGSTRPSQRGCDCFGCCSNDCCFRCNQFCSTGVCSRWKNCWFFVKDTFYGYIRPKDGVVRCVGLFDHGFDVSQGVYSTGMKNGIQLYNHSRFVMLKGNTRRSTKEWLEYIKHVASNQASQFINANPNNSFAPVRTGVHAGWFVDGASYMSCVADALERAQDEIYIADWWLSPEIYMKRPAIDGFYWRLDKILLRKAKQGVRIFVLLYKEVEMALGINSFYSKQRLAQLHENIRVLRHPDHARAGVFFWAHHEKLVIIDQTYAFVGGIDLCYGRWDDHNHRLTDLGSISTPLQNPITMLIKGAQNIFTKMTGAVDTVDASTPIPNKRVVQIEDPEDAFMAKVAELKPGHKPNTPELERKNRLSAVKDKVKTKGRDFMNLLSLNESEIAVPEESKKGKEQPDACRNLHFNEDEMKDAACGGMEDPSQKYTDPMVETLTGQAKLWIGKDYCNFIYKDFINLDMPHDDFVDRTQTPRMPWHDIATVVVGSAARDAARHFIQRWNAVKLEKARDNLSYPYLMPRTYQEIKIDPNFISIPMQRVTCQVLRSSSSWSAGFLDPEYVEQSIHEAYIDTITKAQHYIYIENQFFISMERGNFHVKNGIAERLFERIMRAVKEKKVFRVFVVMPLLPGFEGDVGGTSGNAVRVITHWNYSSINRGQYSLISRLISAGVEDPFQYITFHSLRTHSVLNGFPITELIYVHSKLLICDDKTIICGSANINDRSLIGKRDSEVAVIINDESFEDGRMNGETFPSGLYAGRLRRFLFREHLGMLDPQPHNSKIDINDPISDQFYNGIWRRTSNRNTRIFDEVFKCIPTNNTETFAQLKTYLDEEPLCKTDVKAAEERIKQIEGYLVDLPLEFLKKEVLTPPMATKEGMMPISLWV